MCYGMLYKNNNEESTAFFADTHVRLPVQLKNGEQALIPWGRRKCQTGNLPLGGWAKLDAIQHGDWDEFFPKPVKIIVEQFMELDIENEAHWFILTAGQCIQGLFANFGYEHRVYVVTISPGRVNAEFQRWPRLLSM